MEAVKKHKLTKFQNCLEKHVALLKLDERVQNEKHDIKMSLQSEFYTAVINQI